MAEGIIVVRGPDWKWGNQDGGEGGKGTVLKALRNATEIGGKKYAGKTAIVKWSSDSGNVYRVGAEDAFDLRVLDNSSTGGKHDGVKCDACDEWNFKGMRWKCVDCPDYDLCTTCYMSDKHLLSHEFWRIYTPGAERVNVGKRRFASKVEIKKSANIQVDSVLELLVKVAIESKDSFYYRTHLPKFELPPFIVDDKVRIDSNEASVKAKQRGHGGWNEKMSDSLGKIGKVMKVDSDGDLRVGVAGYAWTYNPASVTRVDDDAEVITLDDIGEALNAALSGLLNDNGSVFAGLLRSLSENISSVEIRPSSSSSESSGRVKEVTDEEVDTDAQDKDGNTPLHLAAKNGDASIGECLLKTKATANKTNFKGQTALHYAVEAGSSAFVEVLLKYDCGVQIPDSYGNTALHCAIGKKDPGIVDLLLSHPETDLKLKNNKGYNALHHAVWNGNDHAVEKIIEKAPYLIDKKNDDGNTALHLAVRSGHYNVTKILIEKGGCELDVRNEMQETPLLVAAKMSRCAEVELLMFLSADVTARDESGNTALHLALLNQRIEDGTTPTSSPAISRIFSDIGRLPGIEKNFGLAIACFLAQKGGDLRMKNGLGKTPLDLVPSTAVQELLIKYSGRKVKIPSLTSEPEPKADETKECLVCAEKAELVVLKPCGHRVVCKLCSERLKKCLDCRALIVQETAAATVEDAPRSSTQSSGNLTYSEQRRRDVMGVLGAKRR